MSDIDILKAQVVRLKNLLDDPHPGLSTWAGAFGELMEAISKNWGEKLQWFKATEQLPNNYYFWRPDKNGKILILWVINGEIFEHGTTRIRTGFSWGEWCPIRFPD